MSIYRVKKDSNYVVMNKTVLYDDQLSWKAKGLHAYMLSMPDDWTFYNEELVKHSKDGMTTLRSALKELKDLGYLARRPIKNEKGKITEWETLVYENPQVENPQVENLQVENRKLLNNDLILSNESILSNDNNISIVQFEEFWTKYPRKEGKKKSKDKFIKLLKQYSFDQIMNGTQKYVNYLYATKTKKQFIKQPLTFLNGEHFNDEYDYLVKSVSDYEFRNGELPF